MALLDDILAWSQESLKPWQQDAVRRLFQKVELGGQDVEDLYAMLRSANGVSGSQAVAIVPFAAAHIPQSSGTETLVTLKALKDLTAVNRIASTRPLSFAPTGLTAIYGRNGSGKSGYSRVLKKACRARDQADDVLTDATDLSQVGAIPNATFEVQINGTDKIIPWKLGQAAPDELASVAVFDGRCARIYLDGDQSVAYLPYGLDVLEALANKVLPALQTKLNLELSGINADVSPFSHLNGVTAVGKLVASLGHSTDPKAVESLATLSPEQHARLNEIAAILKEADPTAKAKEIRKQAGRMQGIIDRLNSASAWATDEAVEKLKGLDQDLVQAMAVEKAAAETLRSGESLLPGTGDAVWKDLFKAAARYSDEVAYLGHVFPHVGAGTRCVLCQQQLEDGAPRLKRFHEYLAQDVAKTAELRRTTLQGAVLKIEGTTIEVNLEKHTREELQELDATLLPEIEGYAAAILERRAATLAATKSHDWTGVPGHATDPREKLGNLVQGRINAAVELENADDKAKRAALQSELDELAARKALAVSKTALLSLIDRLKLRESLERCKQELNTNGISTKSRELASQALTKALQSALSDELARLGFTVIKTKLSEKIVKGRPTYRILLDLPSGAKNVNSILSEGEQRIIAIASFLAELRLASHNGAIIFDDPVSSLDHLYREKVAQRLVQESEVRQVIVLTHDTTFLAELQHAVDVRNAATATGSGKSISVLRAQYLDWNGTKAGDVQEGLPWDHRGYKERLASLKQEQSELAKSWPPYPNEERSREMRTQYSLLRSTVERVTQDVVLGGVVKRFDSYVNVGLLKDVIGLKETEQAVVYQLWRRCSEVTEAHDPASGKNSTVPTADELGKDIADLEVVVDAIKARRSAAKS